MSAVLTPIGNNIVQIGVYSDGDTYTHIRAGSVDCAGISCDTVADLPAQAGGITGYYLEQESTAHVIEDNTIYTLDSNGTWILQDEASRMDVYTKAETDTEISNAVSPLSAWISKLLDYTCKNLLDVFSASSGTQTTINGVTWTVHKDGTVTADSGGNPATANSFFYIWGNPTNVSFNEKTVCGGCPTGGSSGTYELQIAEGSTIKHDYGDGLQNGSGYTYRYLVLVVRSGYVANNLTFKPFVYPDNVYNQSPDFSAFAPTLPELYAMFKGITT